MKGEEHVILHQMIDFNNFGGGFEARSKLFAIDVVIKCRKLPKDEDLAQKH